MAQTIKELTQGGEKEEVFSARCNACTTDGANEEATSLRVRSEAREALMIERTAVRAFCSQ